MKVDSFVLEAFQVRVFLDNLTTVWTAILHSVEDNKTMRLTHPNLGKLLSDCRNEMMRKEVSLKHRNGE